MASGTIEYRDGVKVVVAPDGAVYRYADIQRYNNPGVEFDDATGEALATLPTVGEPAPYTPPGSLGARVGNEDLAAGRALALDPDVSMYSMMDQDGRYADTPLGYLNQAAMRLPDLALGGLLALGGGASKAMGYGSDVLGLDLQPGDIPDVEEQGQLADALFALPTARMLGGMSEAGTRSAMRAAMGAPDLPSSSPASDFGRGWQEFSHWTRSDADFDAFDPDVSTGSTSRLGPHIGTRRAAEDRAAGYGDVQGRFMDLRADTSKPFFNPSTGEPWSEFDIEMFISRLADENQMDRRDVPPFMRQQLAAQGYTDIPYINDVEDPGSVSHIMLVDRPRGSDAVLRRADAAFDPRKSTSPSLLAGMSGFGLFPMLSQQEEPR